MQTVSKSIPGPKKRGARAQSRLVAAYRNLFAGKGSAEDADIVKSDLATFSGFFMTMTPDAPDATLRYAEGRRSVMHHIMGKLVLSDGELAILANAAYQEAQINEEQGPL